MEKGKTELTENKNSGANKRKNKSSVKNRYSIGRECKENPNLKKRVTIKNDGRYLIFYDF